MADDVLVCCEVDSFGIDDVVSAVDSLTGGVALGLATISLGKMAPYRLGSVVNAEPTGEGLGLGIGIAYSACEKEVLAALNGTKESAADGLGLGSGIASAGAGRAVFVAPATCCVG